MTGSLGVMGRLRELVEQHRSEIHSIVAAHKGRSIALFGSVARDEEHAGSDLDFLVDFESGSTLFDLMDISDELEQQLGVPVDVISVRGLKERDEEIRSEAILV